MEKNKPKKRNAGLFSRVLKGYTLIVVIVLSFACLVSVQLVRKYAVSLHKDELMHKALFILPSKGAMPDWSMISKYQKIADAEIIFITTDYVALSVPKIGNEKNGEVNPLQPSYVEVVSRMDREIIDSIFEGKGVTGVEDVDFLTQHVLYAGIPVFSQNNELMGAMMLFRPLDNIDDIWMPVMLIFVIACVSGVLLITGVSKLFSKGLTTPLRIMNNAANKMAEGDYSQRIDVKRPDEIGMLGETLNLLSSRLQNLIESLQNEKSKLELVLMNIGEGIVACDTELNILHLNNAALGYLEICDWEQTQNEGRMRVLDLIRICMTSGEIETHTWKNQSKRDISFIATPIRNAEKVTIGAVCLLRDVSREMHLEQRRREYIGNVSHELKTPLTGIRGMIEPLMDDILETEEEKQDSYRIIYKETLRLEKLIGEMLELSRFQEGRVQIDIERIRLSEAVESGIEAMKPLAEKANIRILTDMDESLTCYANADRVSELIVILVDNAISFTPEGGKIEVEVKKQGCKAMVRVTDNGAGIEPRDIPYIWERFYKADKSRLRTNGTGLGLAIAKHIIDGMNGCIYVESEIGKGTSFYFKLNM